MQIGLIIGSKKLKYIGMYIRSKRKRQRSSWLLFGWKVQPLYARRENFRKVVSIMVNSFLHGMNLHLH
jgi:hypothetical protein